MSKICFFMTLGLLITLLCGSFLLSGCKYNVFDLETTEEVVFELPKWPPVLYKGLAGGEEESPYPQLSRWLVEISCAEYDEKFYVVNGDENELALTVMKNSPVAVSAAPITLNSYGEEVSFFKPAGAIYPFDDCVLTWDGGFPVYIFQTLYKSKKETGVSAEHMENFINHFNWKKMQRTVLQKESGAISAYENGEKNAVFYNPWQLDIYTLLDNLCFGTFKAALMNTKNVTGLPQNELHLSSGDLIFSSYIPENVVLWKYGEISLKKNYVNLLNVNGDYGAIIKYTSSKNISLEFIFMPIYVEEI